MKAAHTRKEDSRQTADVIAHIDVTLTTLLLIIATDLNKRNTVRPNPVREYGNHAGLLDADRRDGGSWQDSMDGG